MVGMRWPGATHHFVSEQKVKKEARLKARTGHEPDEKAVNSEAKPFAGWNGFVPI